MVDNVFGGGDTRNSKKGTITAKQFKVIMIGESMVGKTSLIQRFVEGQFHTGNAPTLAWDFKVKTMQVENPDDPDIKDIVRLYVWDTAGQERFRHIARMYYKDVCGVLICFDLTDEDSFKNLSFWITDLKTHAPESIAKVLIGNKADLCAEDPSARKV